MHTPNKKVAIYHEILQRLLTRHYLFGEKILVKEIGESTGISRQPIMTALNSLQERGFVQIIAQVGCQVVQPTADEVADFYQMFAQTEGLIASLAAERGTPPEVARMQELNEKIAKINPSHSDASDSYRQFNVEFHRLLHAMARSPIVSTRQLANFELSDFFIVQSCGFSAHLSDVTDEHDEIIAALTVRSPDRARTAAMSHIESVSRHVIEALQTVNTDDKAVIG
ncbi:GntR family transcriptional regulator [Pseudomonas sp. ICMP 561]|uniref:GntR family transcriptional regulator n=1 Tax=Pseudomonas sp. ICMP 561 TaxID=1718918 RepID=UPI000C078621|nr:GntR family transcriptional regulator [Pseudomonas sp. ICMP 561]PHN17193.1 GntR family transcriptional regulator [Pseudomonas sp. ICMP 561]